MEIDIQCDTCGSIMDDCVGCNGDVHASCPSCVKEREDEVKALEEEIEKLEYRVDELETFINDYVSGDNVIDKRYNPVKVVEE